MHAALTSSTNNLLHPPCRHGVGWSEIPRYSFKVPVGWEETAVSIADLGGTEIDLRQGAAPFSAGTGCMS